MNPQFPSSFFGVSTQSIIGTLVFWFVLFILFCIVRDIEFGENSASFTIPFSLAFITILLVVLLGWTIVITAGIILAVIGICSFIYTNNGNDFGPVIFFLIIGLIITGIVYGVNFFIEFTHSPKWPGVAHSISRFGSAALKTLAVIGIVICVIFFVCLLIWGCSAISNRGGTKPIVQPVYQLGHNEYYHGTSYSSAMRIINTMCWKFGDLPKPLGIWMTNQFSIALGFSNRSQNGAILVLSINPSISMENQNNTIFICRVSDASPGEEYDIRGVVNPIALLNKNGVRIY